MSIFEHKIIQNSIVYSDNWHGLNVLDVPEFKHDEINRSKLFADKQNHISEIENFGIKPAAHA